MIIIIITLLDCVSDILFHTIEVRSLGRAVCEPEYKSGDRRDLQTFPYTD